MLNAGQMIHKTILSFDNGNEFYKLILGMCMEYITFYGKGEQR